MKLKIITKKYAVDPAIQFPDKLISKPFGRATAMPTAWALKKKYSKLTLASIPASSMIHSRFIPISRHFSRRHAGHCLRLALSMIHFDSFPHSISRWAFIVRRKNPLHPSQVKALKWYPDATSSQTKHLKFLI